MDISANYSNSSQPIMQSGASTSESATVAAQATAKQPPVTGTINISTETNGKIVDMVRNEVSIKLQDGSVVKGNMESFPDVKIGDNITFTVSANENGQPVVNIIPNDGADPKLAMMKLALEAAGLKADDQNLKLVALLIDKEMPINKQSIQTLSKITKVVGMENANKALILMKNDIPVTLTSVERLDEYIKDSGKLLNQIDTLAKTIMGMENGPEKQKILESFENAMKTVTGGGTKESQRGSVDIAGQAGQPAGTEKASAVTANTAAVQNAKTPATSVVQTVVLSAESSEIPLAKINTSSPLFREIFGEESAKSGIESHLREHPITKDAAAFISNNLDKLKAEFQRINQNGQITKENIAGLIKILGGEKILECMKSNESLKTFVIALAEKGGIIDESIEQAEKSKNEMLRGAKKITDSLCLSLDNKGNDESIDKIFDKMKDKLSEVAKNLGDGKDSVAVKQNLEDIKDNLKFVERFKNDPFMQIPLTLNEQQTLTELFVFSDGKNKNKRQGSQSALISLDLSNLGHFETYVQKEGNDVVCQFRLPDEEIEKLVKKHIEQLKTGLKHKGFNLSSISFKQIDEKFTLTDGDPGEERPTVKVKNGRFSLDFRA